MVVQYGSLFEACHLFFLITKTDAECLFVSLTKKYQISVMYIATARP